MTAVLCMSIFSAEKTSEVLSPCGLRCVNLDGCLPHVAWSGSVTWWGHRACACLWVEKKKKVSFFYSSEHWTCVGHIIYEQDTPIGRRHSHHHHIWKQSATSAIPLSPPHTATGVRAVHFRGYLLYMLFFTGHTSAPSAFSYRER